MLGVDADVVRLFLHVLGATIWVGGQLTLAALASHLRTVGPEATRTAARAFNRVAWPAYVLLLGTGAWNVVAENRDGTAWQTTLMVKIGVVALSGATAFLHVRATSRRGLAIFGALSGLSALAALFLGVMLAG